MVQALPPLPPLRWGDVAIRAWTPDDLGCVAAASAEGVIPGATTVPATWSPAAGHDWIDRQHDRRLDGQGWSCAITEAITDAPTDRAIGCIVLLLRPQPGVLGLGYWLAPDARGRGAATTAVRLVTEWALGPGAMHRVEAWVEPDNRASLAVLDRAGFQHEGRLRSFLAMDGRRTDVLVLSRIRDGDRTDAG